MATTCEPARVVDTLAASPTNASPRLLAVSSLDDAAAQPHMDLTTAEPSPRSDPPPNPPFVFPRREPASAPTSFSRATARRPRSAIETSRIPGGVVSVDYGRSSRPALPDFSFNPGMPSSPQSNGLLSPSISPPSSAAFPSPSKAGGHWHRRGGSEFVGGSIRDGDSIMNTSPAKSVSGFSPLTGPPPNRRGRHAHRRSAALSSHDLSIILQPPTASPVPRGESAPTSPSDLTARDLPSLPGPAIMAQPAESVKTDPNPVAVGSTARPRTIGFARETKPIARARVGFSETVEFIPRPLSLISSDTSSTVTVKPSHSVSGSISSLLSTTTPIVAEQGPPEQVTPPLAREKPESRPSTAGAVLERTPSTMGAHPTETSPRRRNSNPALAHSNSDAVESAEPCPTKPPKRWSFFGLDSFTSNQQNRSRPESINAAESTIRDAPSELYPDDLSPAQDSESPKPGAPPRKRKGKKPSKKVKTWAGSILTRKSKPRSKGGKNSRPSSANSAEVGKKTPVWDGGVTQEQVITPVTPEITIIPDDSDETTMARFPSHEEDSSFPMIDLDAALGPFNTPLPNNPEWEAAQRAAGNAKRRLHSAQKLRGFSGPGMHYHRRSESAPELVPFEDARFGMHRFGSNSTMADVFEEDEEEDEEEETSSGTSDSEEEKESDKESIKEIMTPSEPSSQTTPTPTTSMRQFYSVDSSQPSAGIIRRRRSSALSYTEERQPVDVEGSSYSYHDDLMDDHGHTVQFRTSSIFQGNSSPASSAAPSPRRILAARDLAPVDVSPLQLPSVCHAPVSPYSMSHGSSFPSPRSAMSVDAQRISTAPSSVNDETSFQSLLLGQPGPEVRISVDDIPSLTSSFSTMTRESGMAANAPPPPIPTLRPQRPSSVSSSAFGRRRSSLASLSRLISSSHGERSKLSVELSVDDDTQKKTKSKTRRLSRLVQFWKAKDIETD